MSQPPHISSDLFQFLADLKENNSKEWFHANKKRYEAQVREPLLQFIRDFGARLPEISPYYRADPRKVGGSLFRIHRDVRFAKDKSPYKTTAGVQFRHESGKDAHAPGFYLHMEPDNVFVGVGMWRPDTKTLNKVRDAIIEKPERWQAVLADKRFTDIYELVGESLKRCPKGYDPNHPLIVELRRKDWIATTALTQETACAPGFIDHFTELCRGSVPFMSFLTTSIGLSW